jgi:hypothetical protein
VVLFLLAALMPASARAAIFTVTSDLDAAGNCAAGSPTCTLRQAITDANAAPDHDDIAFSLGAARIIEIQAIPSFPAITSPVLIDGTTQPGFDPAGQPPVELFVDLNGPEFDAGSAGSEVRGLTIYGEAQIGIHVLPAGGPVTITHNVLGMPPVVGDGFHNAAVILDGAGSVVGGSDPTDANVLVGARNEATAAALKVTGAGNTVVGNTIGLEPDGTTPWDPSRTPSGVVVACGATGTKIENNVIGGVDAAVDAGAGACPGTNALEVSGNRIGTTASNDVGVSLHGALPGGVVSGNTIVASDAGPGIAVGGAGVTIRGNSIDGNFGLGIDLPAAANDPGDADGSQNFPAIASATTDGAVTLALGSKPNRDYALEVFASPACDPSGFGEGATPLGTAALHTDGSGNGQIAAVVAARPAGTVVTATATDTVTGDTSEFSACATVTLPLPQIFPPPTHTPTPQPRQLPPPVLRKTVKVVPVKGPVRIRRPRAPRFVPLREGENIPVGSTVDATHGRVRLTSAANKRGKLQAAEFFAGQFRVTQARNGLTELALNGPISCPKRASAAKKKPKKRSLWGDGKGKFRTRGRYGSAAIRGTRWLTSDRCDGTHFAVRSGVVRVKDFTRHRSRLLRAGRRYRAPARR